MQVLRQTTIAKPISFAGEGLHCGADCAITLRPAGAGQGVIFHSFGADGVRSTIKAHVNATSQARNNTSLVGERGGRIATVEHLLAALSLTGIDNVLVELEGAEMPAMDGSAAPYLEAIAKTGVKRLAAAREAIKIMAPVEIVDGDRSIRATPYDGRLFEVSIDFPDEAIGAQHVSIDLDRPADVRRVASARTFCRRSEIEALRAANLSLGGSLENAVVVDGSKILNASGLRDPKEFALHKTLDLIGDLALAGAPILARIEAVRPGHDLNARFVREVLANRACFERVVEPETDRRVTA